MSKVDPGGMTDCRPSRFTSLRRWFAHRPRRNHLRGRKPTYAGIDIGENLIDVTTLSFDGWRNYRIPRDSNDRSNSDSLLIDLNHCLPPVRGGSIVHAAISMGGNGWDCRIGLDDEDETEFGDEEGQSDDSRDPATRYGPADCDRRDMTFMRFPKPFNRWATGFATSSPDRSR